MTSLAHLFTDNRVDDRASAPAEESRAAESEELEGLFDGPRTQGVRVDVVADAEKLLTMVDQAAATARTVVRVGSDAPKRSSRGHKRTDWLNVAAGALAIVVVATTATIAGVQVANASPAASALESLTVEEAELANATIAFEAIRNMAEREIQDGLAEVDELEPALIAVADYSDEDAYAAAEDATATYRADLEAIALPDEPDQYVRAELDEDSLPDVAAAIDEVTERSTEIADLTVQAREAREAVTDLQEQFQVDLSAFGATFPDVAEAVVEDAPGAEQSFRDAVTDAAAAIPAAQAAGRTGAGAMLAYPSAVDALAEDQARAEAEEAARIAAEEAARIAAEEEARRRAAAQAEAEAEAEDSTDPGAGDTDPEEPADPDAPGDEPTP